MFLCAFARFENLRTHYFFIFLHVKPLHSYFICIVALHYEEWKEKIGIGGSQIEMERQFPLLKYLLFQTHVTPIKLIYVKRIGQMIVRLIVSHILT
jgi:hypothetical protein